MFIKIAQLFLSLTILVSLHEFGHFWFAKKFKCRVDKFYLFFDFLFPFANIMNFAIIKKKIGDTEYGLGWFPFGGYVQIAGMVDEQMDKSIIDRPAEPWELRSKPAWQRLLVMMGGIIVNFLLGIFIFWLAIFAWGKDTLPVTNLPHGLMVDSSAYEMGLRNGDYITSLDGKTVKSINRIPVEIIMNGVTTIEGVHADGKKFSLPVDDDNRARILKRLKKSKFVEPRFIPVVLGIDSTSFASNSDLKVQDRIIAVNNVPVKYYDELKAQLLINKSTKAELTLLRGNDTVKTSSQVTPIGTIGFWPGALTIPKIEEQKFGIGQAFVQGVKDGMEQIVMQAKQFVVIFTVKEAHKQVGGFYTMVQQMNPEWDWQSFWMFTGFLSLALAFMNFLPIPMLDGGYIMFILWEMVTGKKVSDKVVYYANNVGLFIVLGLMVYANTDWLRN
ncbi:MAG: RIP metalloprotease RseP [Bacteroidota bacterium]|nr:RIP metalloprotease RseP [Bacteroidota bacterium]MDP3145877.1 RIP metalloprotease RseP [Bacteroidota bacterium]MDP3558511.1 RIP metalloprotease RseP [Bacteroidota bacterium]